MTTTTPETTEPDAEQLAAAKARLIESLKLNRAEIETAEKSLDRARVARKALIDRGRAGGKNRDNLLSYDEMAEHTGLTRSAVYKVARDGFRAAPLGEAVSE